MNAVAAVVTIHTAGPIEANGEQRCLGCDLLLMKRKKAGGTLDYYPFGRWIGETFEQENESWTRFPLSGNRRRLRENEIHCHVGRV